MIAAEDVKARLRPEPLLQALGLISDRRAFRRQHDGFLIRCPSHDDRTPSCSVQSRDGVVQWKCHGCGETGDAITLIGVVRGVGFQDALREAADLAGVIDAEPPRERKPSPERDYPPLDTVRELWAFTTTLDADANAWAKTRGLDGQSLGEPIDGHALARALAPTGELPRWAAYRGRSWRETGHRLIVPMFDATGRMRSVRAIRVTDGDSPKRLPPGGHKAAEIVMADPIALAWLQGKSEPSHLLVVEGEPDFLTAATTRYATPYARIGITSGGWSPAFAARVPKGARVYIATDVDDAGNRYAAQICDSLPNHKLFRWRPPST